MVSKTKPPPDRQVTRTEVRRVPVQAATGAAPASQTAGKTAGQSAAEPVRRVNGQLVRSDEPLPSPLTNGGKQVAFHSLRLLTLADGSTVVGCRDCEFTGSRGDVQRHRYHEHGAARPGPGRKPTVKAAGKPSELPPEVATMSVAELFRLAADAGVWADMLATMEEAMHGWKERAEAAEMWKRRTVLRLEKAGIAFKDDD